MFVLLIMHNVCVVNYAVRNVRVVNYALLAMFVLVNYTLNTMFVLLIMPYTQCSCC